MVGVVRLITALALPGARNCLATAFKKFCSAETNYALAFTGRKNKNPYERQLAGSQSLSRLIPATFRSTILQPLLLQQLDGSVAPLIFPLNKCIDWSLTSLSYRLHQARCHHRCLKPTSTRSEMKEKSHFHVLVSIPNEDTTDELVAGITAVSSAASNVATSMSQASSLSIS